MIRLIRMLLQSFHTVLTFVLELFVNDGLFLQIESNEGRLSLQLFANYEAKTKTVKVNTFREDS